MLTANVSINSNFANQDHSKDYFVYLLLGKNYMQIASAFTKSSKVELLQEYNTGNKNISKLQVEEILDATFIKNAKKVFVGLDSAKSTLIPTSLYNIKEKKNYLKHLYHLNNNEVYAAQPLAKLEVTDVYSIKEGTYKMLEKLLPAATFMHAKTAVLNAYHTLIDKENEHTCFIYHNTDTFWLSILSKDSLLIHNKFTYTNSKDVLYHVLNTLKQLKISKEDIHFQIGGVAAEYPNCAHQLKEQNLNCSPLKSIATLSYPDEMNETLTQPFFNLFALITCA